MRTTITSIQKSIIYYCLLLAVLPFGIKAQDDAGVSSILQPTGTICRGNTDIIVTLKNFGTVDLTSCTIEWSVNGSPQAPYSFSGFIIPGDESILTIGTYSFTGGAYNLQAYSTNPNGTTDADNSNDTSNTAVTVQLSGLYTLGGTTPDFASFSLAAIALNTSGVCGPVIFDVRPGTYSEKVIFNSITGASSTNSITFRSENNDSSSVVLTAASSDTASNNYVVRLNSADYFTFSKLTISRPGNRIYGRVIDFTNTATFNTITNCQLIGAINNSVTNSFGAIIYSSAGSPSNDSMTTITHNLIQDGSMGIYFNGIAPLNLESGTLIRGNTFLNQYARAVQVSYQLNIIIDNNTVTTNSNLSGYYGIYMNVCQRDIQVTNNKVTGVPGTGIYMIDCTAFPVPHGLVANNFVHTTDSMGITCINGDYQDIIFNSVHVTGSNANYAAVDLRGRNLGTYVVNNILANSGGGLAYVVSDSAWFGLESSNYNNLYTTGSVLGRFLGTDAADLTAWKTIAQHDTNSVSVDPAFVSATDLHATSVSMDNKGIPFSPITADIDGETRSLTTPDIGADEYQGESHDVGVVAVISPVNGSCESASTLVKVVIQNFGFFSESSFDVRVEVTGAGTATLTETYAGTIVPGTTDTVLFSATLNTSGAGVYNLQSYTLLSFDDNKSNDTLVTSATITSMPAAPTATGDTLCGPGTGTLTASSSDTLYWYATATGGTPIGMGSPFASPFVSSTTTFYVEAKGVCPSTRTAVDVFIKPLPVVNLGNDTTILFGSSLTLDAGSGHVATNWSTGETTQTILVSPIVNTCYSVTVLGSNGCVNADTICITVVFPTDVGVQAMINPINGQCENAVTPVTVQVRNYGSNSATDIPVTIEITGAVTVTMTDTLFGTIASGASGVLSFSNTINTTGGGILSIKTYTNLFSDQNELNDTLSIALMINAIPQAPVASNTFICGAGPVTLTATATDTIYWYDAPTGGSLLAIGSYSIPFLAATDTFYAQAGLVCPSLTRTEVIVAVYPAATVNLGPDLLIECGVPTLIDAGTGFVSYLWSTNEVTQTIIVDTTGNYWVQVTDANGCTANDTINVDCFVGIQNDILAQEAVVYPNPTSGLLTLQSNQPNKQITYKVFNSSGQVIRNGEFKNKLQLDLSDRAKGIYMVHLLVDNHTFNKLIIVE